MSCKLEHSRVGKNVPEVMVQICQLHHQVIFIAGYELPYSHPETFAVFVHAMEHPEQPAVFTVPEHCPYAGKQRVITIRWQPQYPTYPLAIGDVRVHAQDVPYMFAHLGRSDMESSEPETMSDAQRRFTALIPESLRYWSNTRNALRWFRQRFPFVEKHVHTHLLTPAMGPRPQKRELFVTDASFAGHTVREVRMVVNGAVPPLNSEIDFVKEPERIMETAVFRNIHVVDLPYLEKLWPTLLTKEQFAAQMGIAVESIRPSERLKPDIHPTTPFVIRFDDGKRMARCWRCSRLLDLGQDTWKNTPCVCGAVNLIFNGEFIINAADLPPSFLTDVEERELAAK